MLHSECGVLVMQFNILPPPKIDVYTISGSINRIDSPNPPMDDPWQTLDRLVNVVIGQFPSCGSRFKVICTLPGEVGILRHLTIRFDYDSGGNDSFMKQSDYDTIISSTQI